MRIFSMLIISILLLSNLSISQSVGIGTISPHPSAALDISSNRAGLLIPRMSVSERNSISSPAKGLIVFITNDSSLYYFDGYWQKLVPASQSWSLNGNALSADSTSFLGTTNHLPLRIKVNNQYSGLIDSGTRNHTWGYKALLSNTTGTNNTAIGSAALFSNTTGYDNVSIGNSSMALNTAGFGNTTIGYLSFASNRTGYSNIAIGKESLYGSQFGIRNVSIGSGSMYNNFNGSYNTAVGDGALSNNVLGNYNTALGYSSQTLATITNATAIGANAGVDESNKIVLGNNNIKKVQTAGTIVASGYASGMTTSEILGIAAPIEGTIIYNTTAHKPVYYNGSVWKYFDETNL